VGFQTGDHMLLTDNAYGPARRFANTTLKNFGVETTFFDPMIGAASRSGQPNTKVVYLEAPSSRPSRCRTSMPSPRRQEARRRRLIDNTWATPLCFKPFDRLRSLDPRRHQVHRRPWTP
jgi:cystathionine beta-lyase